MTVMSYSLTESGDGPDDRPGGGNFPHGGDDWAFLIVVVGGALLLLALVVIGVANG